jgi:hypothetical protein
VAAERIATARRRHLWLLLPAAALAGLWLSWCCLAMVDFLYPQFYAALDIQGHIERFGPENRYKKEFETTTSEERFRLFGVIVDAIHDSGRGLEHLEYRDAAGQPLGRLLREPEIVHLQDVARLVDRLAPIGWMAVAWTGIHLLLIRLLGWAVPPLSRLLGASVLATVAAFLLVIGIGPRKVSHVLHELVFPPENTWFFYYQDSLMSTMMKAPDLFGAIAVALVALGLLFYAALLYAARRLSPARADSATPAR